MTPEQSTCQHKWQTSNLINWTQLYRCELCSAITSRNVEPRYYEDQYVPRYRYQNPHHNIAAYDPADDVDSSPDDGGDADDDE